jgi:hypothetical protein
MDVCITKVTSEAIRSESGKVVGLEARMNGKLVGFALYRPRNDKWAVFDTRPVDPEALAHVGNEADAVAMLKRAASGANADIRNGKADASNGLVAK